jgi:hypothetical protein
MKEYKISITTVSMNRLNHVKKTLIANIEDNKDYKNLEFLLLDYNSTDGTEEWVKNEMMDYLLNGRLKYFRTEEPEYFDRTHSRNLISKLAEGDILCNVDADNYTGQEYATYINKEFNNDDNIFLVADTKKRYYFLRNAFGRFCCWKKDYLEIGGMDESMKSYGSETLDLYERFELLGRRESIIKDINFLKAISHEDDERISNEYFLRNIYEVYIRFYSFQSSELIFLFKNNSYEKCVVIPEEINTHLPATLVAGTLVKGCFKISGNSLCLDEGLIYKISHNSLRENGNENLFYKIEDSRFLQQVAKNYSFILNNNKLNENKKEHTVKVNPTTFGKGTVVCNFQNTISLS